jgi:ribbon-helix-helix CopG family protein
MRLQCNVLHSNSGGELMRTQLTVRLTDDLARALDAATRRLKQRNSDIVRMALREFLGGPSRSAPRPIERVRGLVGSLESGMPDLATRHREYILESLTSRRRGRGR